MRITWSTFASFVRRVMLLQKRKTRSTAVHCLIIERAEPMMKKFITVSTRD